MGQRSPAHFSDVNAGIFDEWDVKHLAEITAEAAFPGMVSELRAGSGEILWEIAIDGQMVGSARRVELDSPPWAKPAFGVELNLSALEQRTKGPTKYRPLPSTPSVQADLAVVAEEKITAAQIAAIIRRESGELLESLKLFDEFRGQGIPEGSRSLAWALTFRHPERTLKDKEVQGRAEQIVKALEGELGVRKR
jgi:phenylalanyl-tRNA synthetase beta chain